MIPRKKRQIMNELCSTGRMNMTSSSSKTLSELFPFALMDIPLTLMSSDDDEDDHDQEVPAEAVAEPVDREAAKPAADGFKIYSAEELNGFKKRDDCRCGVA
jgi:hypothetical protein